MAKQSNNDNACVLVLIRLVPNTRTVLHSHKLFVQGRSSRHGVVNTQRYQRGEYERFSSGQ